MEETNDQITPIAPDLISEILLRLPIKPLARFKSVSKSWLFLINSPHFIKLYLLKSLIQTTPSSSLALLCNPSLRPNQTGPTNLLVVDPTSPDYPPSKLNLCFTQTLSPFDSHADIVSSCHGLLGISNYPSWFAIFNPMTQTHKVVSFPDSVPEMDQFHWVDFGFGFDRSSDDYKVVRLDQINGPDYAPAKKVSVYSLKTQSWKRVDECFPHFLCHPKGHGRYASNYLFWLTTTDPPKIYDLLCLIGIGGYDPSHYDYAIVAFDLATEKFKLFDLPEYGVEEKLFLPTRLSLWVLDGKDLCLMVVHGEFVTSPVLDVWLLKDVGVNGEGGWKKIVSGFAYARDRQNELPLRPLVIRKGPGGNEELLFSQMCHLFWYDLRSGQIRDGVTIDYPLESTMSVVSGYYYCFDPVPFVPSLVSLGASTGGCSEVNVTNGSSSATREL